MEKQDYFMEFKPIRNKIRSLNLTESLKKLHILLNRKPVRLLPEVAEFIYINLIIYASELIGKNDKNDKYWNSVISDSQALKNKISFPIIETKVWRWIHAFAINQLKSNQQSYLNSVYRYYYIFSDQKISNHIEKVIKIKYKDYFICGLWLHAVFSRKFEVSKSYFLIPDNESSSFAKENILTTLDILSLPFNNLKNGLKDKIKYDEDTFISHGYPHIIKPIFEKEDKLYCMFPDHLLTQLLSGIYYIAGIGNNENNLQNAFGKAFERYVGLVLEKTNYNTRWNIYNEIEYEIKGNKVKSSDWIVLSNDCIVFIECKTKRLRLPSKSLILYQETLDDDINFIVSAATQLYKVYDHYKDNKIPGLTFDSNKKFIPLIITLEDWYAGGPDIESKAIELLKKSLLKANIAIEIINSNMFKTYSISSFERDVQLMFSLGFTSYFEKLGLGKINEDFVMNFSFVEFFEEEFEQTFLKPTIIA